MNLKKAALLMGYALIFALALPLRAQTGCDDSPEDPTIILALVAGVGMFGASIWAARGRKR